MEWTSLAYTTIFMLILVKIIHLNKYKINRKLPPGPLGWPVFGHMFSLGTVPHRTIAELGAKYGPVVWLRLGSINTMAVLTAKAATELFKNHDLAFADRAIIETMTSHDYHKGSMAVAPYGPRWRVLRRICTVEMFVNKRVNDTAWIRQKCVDNMVAWIEKERNKNGDVSGILVGRYAFLASFNMLGNLIMSRDLVGPESKIGLEFYEAMKRIMMWSSKPNVSDLFPWLRRIDPQGLKRKADRDMGIAYDIVSGFVEERIEQMKNGGEKEKDLLDVMLEFEGDDEESGKLSKSEIIIFILEMFLAGSETTSTSIEWAMTELLRNPEKLAKVKQELSRVLGPNNKFQDNDIDRLPYFQAVVKEALRLHPPLTLLLPRRAVKDTNFMGYLIPENTQVFVNAWAIGRDPECWDDASFFKPERFLGSNIDYKGQHYELIPFGAGRRMCAGLPLGHRMLHFVLGSLLHRFDWELEGSVSPDTIDMRERMGITVGKLQPLIAVPRKCGS